MTDPLTFSMAPDGSPVQSVEISNGGVTATVMTWGAALQDLRREGTPHSLVLGSPDFAAYLGPMRYFGAIVGRVANRIEGGRAMLDGQSFDFDRNEAGRTTLHGGTTGSSQRNWRLEGNDATSCRMTLVLGHGEDGFPGNLAISATYSLDDEGALEIALEGRTDRPTFCGLAHHSYWNLDGTADLARHRLAVSADTYLPVDAELIPLGAPASVEGTGFDFRQMRHVLGGAAIPLDHNFCLRDSGHGLRPACTLAAGDLRLDVTTTAPGLQVYDGANLATAPFAGHAGFPYGAHAGIALEPQHWPDAPHHPDFPSVVLRPDDAYVQRSRFHIRQAGEP